jgi:thiol-disulfide isomerase/thioredoxin
MSLRKSSLVIAGAVLVGLVIVSLSVYGVVRARARSASAALGHSVVAASTGVLKAAQNDSGKMPSLYFAKDPEPVPPFLLRDLSGNVVSTAALKGKVVILNFWATWCGPCREEIPEMIALQAQYKDQLQVIGLSEDEEPPALVAQFAKKAGINYPVVMASAELEKEYGGIAALPTSFFVNPDGRVVAKDVGVYPSDYYDLQVRALAGLPVSAHIETFKDTGQIFLKNAAEATELPGVSFAGLTPEQKKAALRELNSKSCNCGCQLTLAECRINDTSCPFSTGLAMKIVRAIAHPSAADSKNPKSGLTR